MRESVRRAAARAVAGYAHVFLPASSALTARLRGPWCRYPQPWRARSGRKARRTGAIPATTTRRRRWRGWRMSGPSSPVGYIPARPRGAYREARPRSPGEQD